MSSGSFVRSALLVSVAFVAATFQAAFAFSGDRDWDSPGSLEVTADFDEDGRADRAALLDKDSITLLLSQQQITVRLTALPDTTGLAATDIDGDGDTDLVSLGVREQIRGWNNQGSGSFVQWTTGPPRARPLEPPAAVDGSLVSSDAPAGPAVLARGGSSHTWWASPRLVFAPRGPVVGLHLQSERLPHSTGSRVHSPRGPPSSFWS